MISPDSFPVVLVAASAGGFQEIAPIVIDLVAEHRRRALLSTP